MFDVKFVEWQQGKTTVQCWLCSANVVLNTAMQENIHHRGMLEW
jgi:hypothetical protein